jgi:hypothetical protein
MVRKFYRSDETNFSRLGNKLCILKRFLRKLRSMTKSSKCIVSLLFQKSVNNGRSSKFSLASKQGKKRFETPVFPSLVVQANTKSNENFDVFFWNLRKTLSFFRKKIVLLYSFDFSTIGTINHRCDTSWQLQLISSFRWKFDVPCVKENSFVLPRKNVFNWALRIARNDEWTQNDALFWTGDIDQ